ncbi:hypothetical protein [Legionella quateirensis]|nr:hypothetical protein [Legionella quateirensis]
MIDYDLLERFNIPQNTPLEEIRLLLVQKEKSIIENFFGNPNIAWEYDLSALKALKKITPWPGKEMNSYYDSRQDSDEIKGILTERRKEIIAENFLTNYDDYQLIRTANDKKQLDEAKQLADQLSQLSALGELFVQANPDTSDVNKDTYYLSVLFRVLDTLRVELATHNQNQPSTPNPYLINRIDAVNRLLANYLLNIIITKRVDENKELLNQIFKAIGSQDQEILPWLSVFFKRELLVNSEGRDQLIEEFLKLSHIKYPTPIGQKLLEIGGQKLTPAIDRALTDFLKIEANVWNDLASQAFEHKLQKYEAYLLNSHLSDWVMLNICKDLIAEAKKQPQHLELSRVLYLCCKRVYQDQHYLEQAHGYLALVNTDIENKSLPALSLAAMSDINMIVKKAFELGMVPPSAEIFYEMIKDADQFIAIISKYDKPSLIKLLSTIFIDGNQLDQHLSFIDSELANKIGLKLEDFPLMALRKHYEDPNNQKDPIPLWEAVLDSGIIMQSTFLASRNNEQLFGKFDQVGSQLIIRDKILQYPERYKELCLALAVYCTLHTKPIPGFLFTLPHLKRDQSVAWASKLFMAITSILPQNLEQKVELRKVLGLLGMTIDPPNQVYIDERDLVNKSIISSLDANAQKPGVNPTYTLELLRGIIFSYANESANVSLTPTQMNQLDLFPKCHLPTQFFQIMAAAKQVSSTAIPEFLPYTQKIKLLKTIAATETAKAFFSPFQALSNLAKNLSGKKEKDSPETVEDKRTKQEQKELFTFIQLYLEYCQQELTQNNQLENTEKHAYDNFVQYWTNPIIAKICETAGEMTQYLEKETDGIPLLDLLDDKIRKQVEDWDVLKDKMRRCFLNLTDAAKIQSLIISVNQLIDTHSGQYAKLLMTLRDDLRSLEVFAKKQRPETISKFDQEKCFNAIKIIKEQCGLYQKHLNDITQEKQAAHNAERIQRAKNKLSDLHNMLKFDETKNPSEQLMEFNTQFELFKKRYAAADPVIEDEKANKRFWRRIGYALLTVGIYAIMRGTQLGTFQFWKSHKDVLRDKVEEASPMIRLT